MSIKYPNCIICDKPESVVGAIIETGYCQFCAELICPQCSKGWLKPMRQTLFVVRYNSGERDKCCVFCLAGMIVSNPQLLPAEIESVQLYKQIEEIKMFTNCSCGGRFHRTDIKAMPCNDLPGGIAYVDMDDKIAHWSCDKCDKKRTQRKRQPGISESDLALYRNDSLSWLNNAKDIGGSFIKAFSQAVINADLDNLRILLPALQVMRKKYPHYDLR